MINYLKIRSNFSHICMKHDELHANCEKFIESGKYFVPKTAKFFVITVRSGIPAGGSIQAYFYNWNSNRD